MRVLILGATGFIGSQLAATLIARGRVTNAAGELEPITELVLADVRPPARIPSSLVPVRTELGDCVDLAFLQRLFEKTIDSIFPLAATLTTEAETNFSRGFQVNVLAFMQLLETCRQQARAPRVVYASSIAAFGGPLPDTVDDGVARTPQTSYGTHKAIAELLITDYSRHGFIDGRALRLPVVLIRPGAPSPAVSDYVASLVREPLQGRDVVCPFDPDTRMPVASVRRVAESLIAVHDLPSDVFGHTRAMNLPALTVSVREMTQALERFSGRGRLGRVTFKPQAVLQKIVDSWPKASVSEFASQHGIRADAGFDDIIRAFIEDYLGGG
jgi:nucleoside-diphosphate-sugar epimerase